MSYPGSSASTEQSQQESCEQQQQWEDEIKGKASLHDIEAALPAIIHSTRQRDRLRWITGGKSRFETEISQNQWIDSSVTLNLLKSLSQDM